MGGADVYWQATLGRDLGHGYTPNRLFGDQRSRWPTRGWPVLAEASTILVFTPAEVREKEEHEVGSSVCWHRCRYVAWTSTGCGRDGIFSKRSANAGFQGACRVIDLALRFCLVALTTSLGWAIRGVWGHWWGETAVGALCGMSIWLAFGESGNAWQMLVLPQRSPGFGLFAIFLVGGMIGFYPATALGLLMRGASYGLDDLALWAVLASLGAFLAYKLLVLGLGLRLSPPRSDYWAATLGGAVSTMAYFAAMRDLVVLGTGLLGWFGYGGGFVAGLLLHRKAVRAGWRVDSWKWMEHSVGFFGGISLAHRGVLVRAVYGSLGQLRVLGL